MKLSVVGSFVMDLITRVDAFPSEGQTLISDDFKCLPGGKGANQAIAAARLGTSVAMFGRLGSDSYGDTFETVFKEAKVDISHVKRDPERPTAMGLIQINRSAENKIIVVPGANFGYTLEDLDNDFVAIADSDLVITQMELKQEVTFELIRKCHNANIPIVLNPAPADFIPDEVLSKVTYLTPNETELEILSGVKVTDKASVEQAITYLLSLGVGTVIATLGKQGAVIGNKEGFEYVTGFTVNAVDTVAAGDSFNGALVSKLIEKHPLKEAVKFANAVGALTVTKHGAIPSLPFRSEVEHFISSNQ
ncbi:MAG: ribokinase [Clostridiales bacterium 38-18]|nr:MAG: ribokinase [Clostridiales bacterium 38-18]